MPGRSRRPPRIIEAPPLPRACCRMPLRRAGKRPLGRRALLRPPPAPLPHLLARISPAASQAHPLAWPLPGLGHGKGARGGLGEGRTWLGGRRVGRGHLREPRPRMCRRPAGQPSCTLTCRSASGRPNAHDLQCMRACLCMWRCKLGTTVHAGDLCSTRLQRTG